MSTRRLATLLLPVLGSVFLSACVAHNDLFYEGMAHFNAGRDGEAVAVLTEAVGEPGPELPWVHKARAAAYMRLGEPAALVRRQSLRPLASVLPLSKHSSSAIS